MNDRTLPQPTSFSYASPPQERDASQMDIAGAAFRQENDIVNAFDLLMNRNREPVDPDFDFLTEAKKSKYWDTHASQLARATSSSHLRSLELKLKQEEEDRALLASQGAAGFVWAMAAGLASPTIAIPLIGQARGALGAGQAFALAGAAAVAQEAPLFANQLTRTGVESGISIAGGTVLGGILGSTAVYLRERDFARIAEGMAPGVSMPKVVMQGMDGRIGDVDAMPLQMPKDMPQTPMALVKQQKLTVKNTGPQPVITTTPLTKTIDNVVVNGEVAGNISVNAQTGIVRNVELAESYRGQGIAQRLYDQVEEQIGRRLIPSPVSLSDDAKRFWQNRLSVMTRAEAESIIEESRQVGKAQGLTDDYMDERLGGLLRTREPEGASVGAKSRSDQFTPMRTVVDKDGSVSYEPFVDANGVVEPGEMAPATFVGRVAAVTSPILRGINQFDQPTAAPQTRRIFQQMSDSGVAMTGNKSGISTTAEGTIEHRLGYYTGLLGNFYREQYDAYMEYIFEGAPTFAQRRAASVLTEANRAPKGKLTFAEFKEQVADAANIGDRHEIPQVQKSANAMRELYSKVHEAADEAADIQGGRRLYAFFDPKDETQSYMHHQFDPEKVAEQREQFINDVAKHYQQALESTFGRRVAKAMARAEAETQYENILRMPAEEAQKLYDELSEQLTALRDPSNLQEVFDTISHIRAEARQVFVEEFDRLEKGNAREDPEITKANRRLARQATAEEVEGLNTKADELEATLPKEATENKIKRTQLRRMRQLVGESAGRLETKQANKLNQIEAAEDANIRNFERVVRGTTKFLRGMSKLTDKAYAEQLQKSLRTMELAVKRLDANERAIDKLVNKADGEPTTFDETLRDLADKAGTNFERLKNAEERLAKVKNLDRVAAEKELRAILDDVIAYTNGVNSRRSERIVRLRQQAKELDPEQVELKIKGQKEQQLLRFEKLEDQLQGAGAIDINAAQNRFDFSEIAREAAVDLQNKIAGINSRVAQIDTMAELRSPMKRRMLNMPYDVKRKYLELDTEKLLTRYTRTMGADIELYRAYGSVDGSTAQRAIVEEFTKLKDYLQTRAVDEKGKPITDAQRTKDLVRMNKAQDARLAEFSASVERIRGIRGAPRDPSAMSYRLGRLFMNWNVASMMGSAAVTSIPDAARAVVAHGMTRTFRDSWMPFISGLVDESQKNFSQQQIKQLRLLGIGNDVYTNTRARGTFDISGVDFGKQTSVERFFDFVAAKTPQVALFGPWTDYMKQMTGAATMARFFSSIDDLVQGKILPEDLEYLTQASISPDMARRIQAQMEKTGTRYKETIIPNLESWDDYGALRAFHAAMSREDARLVITPGLEKPLWMDASMLGRIVGQFRSFTMASNTKILVSGLQQRNMAAAYALQGTAFSLALGAVSYYIWAMTSGDRARKEMQNAGWDVWMDQAIYRSGILGAFSEIQNVGSEIPLTRPFVSFADDELAGRRANSIVGAVAGPSFGKASDIATLLAGIDDPTEATVRQARKLMPWQNVFYLRNALTEVEQGTVNLLNLPERRQ